MPEALTRECGVCKRDVPGWLPIFGCQGCGVKMCRDCHDRAKRESDGKCPSCGKTPSQTVRVAKPASQ